MGDIAKNHDKKNKMTCSSTNNRNPYDKAFEHWYGISIGLCMSLGVSLGLTVFDNVGLGMAIGIGFAPLMAILLGKFNDSIGNSSASSTSSCQEEKHEDIDEQKPQKDN